MSQLAMYPSLWKNISNHAAYKQLRRDLSANPGNDYNLDERIRCLHEDNVMDNTYKVVLLYILTKAKVDHFSENNPRRTESHGKEKDRNNIGECRDKVKKDPRYEVFLKHLTRHEKSYVLEYEKDGLSVVLKYEEPRMTKPKPRTSSRLRQCRMSKSRTGKTGGSTTDMALDPKCLLSHRNAHRNARGNQGKKTAANDGMENWGSSSHALRPRVKISKETRGVRNKTKCIPQQPNMMNTSAVESNVIFRGQPNLCQIPKCGDDCAVCKRDACTTANKKLHGVERKIQRKRKLTKAVKQNVGTSRMVPGSECTHQNAQKKWGRRKLSRDTRLNVDISTAENQHIIEKTKRKQVNDAGESIVENNKVGETFIKEERTEETCSDVEILESPASACASKGILAPFVTSKEYIGNKPCHEFRRQLLEHLGRPYDKEEYTRLQTTFREGNYFDHHPEVQRKLTKYRYKPRKRLAILRGFVYWLEHVAEAGAFRPWKDGECLAVEPSLSKTYVSPNTD